MPATKQTSHTYNIVDFGASADGKTVNTESIQKAIDTCAENGGGTVTFPAGTFVSGTLFLKSYVSLHLDTGAVLRGSTETDHYPVTIPPGMPPHIEFTRSLIYGEGLKHVGITGQGIIDGNSAGYFEDMQELREADYMAWRKLRPYSVRIVNSEHVILKNITLINACAWCVHVRACRNLQIRGITLNNRQKGIPNADGLDLDGCQDVRISDCDINSSDDALVIFGKETRNILITNCLLSSHCHAFKLYSANNFRTISFNNSIIHDTNRCGISLQMHNGSDLDMLAISNLIMHEVKCPIWIQQSEHPDQEPQGSVSNVNISNIQATGADHIGCLITGTPRLPLKGITLSNIRIAFAGGGTSEQAEQELPELPEHDESVFGRKLHQRLNNYNQFGVLPAYGFTCRHAQDLVLDTISLTTRSPDHRPAIRFEDVNNSSLRGLQADHQETTESLVAIKDSRNLVISECDAATQS